jgi:hypothetical protein
MEPRAIRAWIVANEGALSPTHHRERALDLASSPLARLRAMTMSKRQCANRAFRSRQPEPQPEIDAALSPVVNQKAVEGSLRGAKKGEEQITNMCYR